MSNTTKKDALKAILTAFGQTTNAKTEKALLFQIAESFQAAVEEGSIVINILELPTVTSDDNGLSFRRLVLPTTVRFSASLMVSGML